MELLKRLLLAIILLVAVFLGYVALIRKLDRDALKEKSTATLTNNGAPTMLPAVFTDARLHLRVPTASGDTLSALCDSGGGLSMLMPGSVEGRKLQPYLHTALMRGFFPMQYALFNELCTDPSIPGPTPLRSFPLRGPFARLTAPFLVVPPAEEAGETVLMQQTMGIDAFFGQDLFMGRSWTIDYGREQLWVNTPLAPSEEGRPGVQPLGLQRNSAGEAVFGHGSMRMQVDGEAIDVLFDTGASIVLSQEGRKAFHTAAKSLAGSFIARSVMAQWRKAHPDWTVYPKADLIGDVIEVPQVVIGTDTVGPVLFAERNDENWSKGMIGTMDKVVKGALGGSALRFFKVTVDYNSALIKFERGHPMSAPAPATGQ